MTVEAPDTITGALDVGVPVAWLLLEDIGGTDEPILVGTWTPSTSPRAVSSSTVVVAVDGATIEVTVNSAQASIAALDTRLDTAEATLLTRAAAADLTAHTTATIVADAPLHGVLEHRWAADGWAPFSRHIVNQDGAQVFNLATSGDFGRITSTTADGNHREILVHEGMTAVDGELTAIIRGPSTYVSGNRPQGGLCLGYQLIDGFHVGYVVWYDIFAGNPRVWNLSGWRGNGGATLNQAAGGQYTAAVARDLRVLTVTRFLFGSWINEMVCLPSHLYGLTAGDTLTVDVDDNTFDATAVAVSTASNETGMVQYLEPDTLSAVSLKAAIGTAVRSDNHRRFFPMAIKARRIGTQISVKVWRAGADPEPADWQLQQTVATDADFPTLPSGELPFGLVVGHAHDGSYLDYSDFTFRRLA
jgi:hypothetical protein